MGENIKERQSTADELREQIRHTEGDITKTVLTLEQRLSPSFLRRRVVRNAKRLAWQGTATLLDLAQRTSVQTSLLGGGALVGSALWLIIRKGALNQRKVAKRTTAVLHQAGAAAKAAGVTGLWMLLRKGRAQVATPAREPPVSGMALAATATKAFLGGARSSKKTGTTRPGRKVAWRGLATAIGAGLGSYWYSHKQHRV